MSTRERGRRRAKVIITGQVVAPGTLPSRDVDRLAVEGRRRLALVALGELIFKVQQGNTMADPSRPTLPV